MGRSVVRGRALGLLAVAVAALGWVSGACARTPALKTVRYFGYTVRVPRSWPVYDLSKEPAVCVRFDRHAVYLGTPSSGQRCPAHAAGRSEAILIQPTVAHSARAGATPAPSLPPVGAAGAQPAQGSGGELALPGHGIVVTATWRTQPGLIASALGVGSVRALRSLGTGLVASTRAAAPRARAAAAPATAGTVFTGLGFDPCATPSPSAMSAWESSPYRAVGVYVGGTNMACSQPNLTASWVSAETAAGWNLIPTYVGLQAPSNSCGCAAISASQASAEGVAAANDAATRSSALGIGSGNPIYFDMENYSRGGSNTSAVLAFLAAWTAQLHTLGYKSGVYSSSSSGISDLAAQWGTAYAEPDDLWIADWNGAQTTSDSYVPGSEWANHQRLHQYLGAHNETYAGVTMNIDGDYLDGATASGAVAVGASGPPVNIGPPSIGGVARVRRTLTANPGAWSGYGISYAYQWQLCTPACANLPGATGKSVRLVAADLDAGVRVVVTAADAGGTAQVASSESAPVAPAGYWLYTARGSVYGSSGTLLFGSPAERHVRTISIVGMAASPDGRGYWLASASGRVYAFGDATKAAANAHGHPIAGIAADPRGGYWLFTASGNVYRSKGAGSFGSLATRGVVTSSIVGMAATVDGRGYWLVSSSGQVYRFGDAARPGIGARGRLVAGIVADPRGGYWLFSPSGNIYRSGGAGWFGSLVTRRVRTSSIVGMAASYDGGGYWLVDSSGRVYAFGDAARLLWLHRGQPVLGVTDPAPWYLG